MGARALLACAAGVALGLGAIAPASASSQGVSIVGGSQAYIPKAITVNPGDTVTWTNNDQTAAHNAACGQQCPESFGGPLLHTGEKETFTFRYSGTYNYVCSAHPSMTGTVSVTGNVQPPPRASSSPTSSSAASSPAAKNTSPKVGGTSASPKPSATPSGATAFNPGDNAPATQADVKDYLAGAKLPKPQVSVRLASTATPLWVVLLAAGAMLVAAVLFGIAWFGSPARIFGRHS